jgi:hypothetical protein
MNAYILSIDHEWLQDDRQLNRLIKDSIDMIYKFSIKVHDQRYDCILTLDLLFNSILSLTRVKLEICHECLFS